MNIFKSSLLLGGVALMASQAVAGTVWAVDNLGEFHTGNTNGDRIISYDSTNPTGTVTVVGQTGVGGTLMGGLAFDAAGNLYTGDQVAAQGGLYSINQSTGAATLIGNGGAGIRDMAWDNRNSRMLAITELDTLVSIDLGSGAQTTLATITNTTGETLWIGLTVNAAGSAFIHGMSTDSMYTLDMGTGSATAMSSGIGFNSNFSQGMGTDWSNTDDWLLGGLDGTALTAGSYSIDAGTGAATNYDNWAIISTLPEFEEGDLDFAPVPEPATLAVLGLGALAALRRRKSKKA